MSNPINLQQIYEKKLLQEKRKMKLEMDARISENREEVLKDFEKEVKTRAQALT